jgi:hypothetical protein
MIDIPPYPPQRKRMSQTLPLIALFGAAVSMLRNLIVSAIGTPLRGLAVNVPGVAIIRGLT